MSLMVTHLSLSDFAMGQTMPSPFMIQTAHPRHTPALCISGLSETTADRQLEADCHAAVNSVMLTAS